MYIVRLYNMILLRCTAGSPNIPMHHEVVTQVNQHLHHLTHVVTTVCVCLVRRLKIYSLGKLQVYNTVF